MWVVGIAVLPEHLTLKDALPREAACSVFKPRLLSAHWSFGNQLLGLNMGFRTYEQFDLVRDT